MYTTWLHPQAGCGAVSDGRSVGDTAVAPGSAAGTAPGRPTTQRWARKHLGGWLLLPLSWGCGGVWEAWLRAAPWVRCSEGAGSWGSGMSGCPNGCASLRSQRPPGSTGVGDTVCSEQPPHPHPIPIPIPSYPHPPAQGEERVLPPGPRPSPAEPCSVLGQPWQRTELSPHTTTSAPIPAGGMEGTALP